MEKNVWIVSWTRIFFSFRFVLWFPQTVTRQAKLLSDRAKPLRRLLRAKLQHEKEAEIFFSFSFDCHLRHNVRYIGFFSKSIYYALVFLDSKSEQSEK